MPYEDTAVTVDKSQSQIRKLLRDFDVEAVRFTSFPAFAQLEFVRKVEGGQLTPFRITIKPKITGTGYTMAALDKAEKQIWRLAYWWLKAKVEAVKFGLVEFEQDFLPYMLIGGESGPPVTVATVFFERLAGRLALQDDPFGGLRPALPEGRD